MASIYGGSARNFINQNELMVHRFSGNGILLYLGEAD